MLSQSRLLILEHLQKHGESSAAELGRSLGLTPVTIRHHLEAMISEGLIDEPEAQRRSGPGRPQLLYRAASSAEAHQPRSYEHLCLSLIDAARSSLPPLQLSQLILQAGSRVATLVAEQTAGRTEAKADLLFEFFEEQGYYPSLESLARGLLIQFANCPYLDVSQNAPEVCLFDLELISSFLDRAVRFERRIIAGDRHCQLFVENDHQV